MTMFTIYDKVSMGKTRSLSSRLPDVKAVNFQHPNDPHTHMKYFNDITSNPTNVVSPRKNNAQVITIGGKSHPR